MSAKNLDNHNRWRSKTIAFRVSPEENEQIEIAVRLSGLTKQDYITRRLLNRDSPFRFSGIHQSINPPSCRPASR